MKKNLFFVVSIVFLMLSLNSCALLQKVMDVSGSWDMEWEWIQSGEKSSTELNINQIDSKINGNIIIPMESQDGVQTGMYSAIKFTGEVQESGEIIFSSSIEGLTVSSTDSTQLINITYNYIFTGKIAGNNSVFQKNGLEIKGEIEIYEGDMKIESQEGAFSATRKN
ncbi:MAG TPA: hypothetical protein PLO84_12165 [Thermotogota bacterium]|nr:hypothetical protein [Thermotogota bacterium]HPJ89861.1 hypothetical protein [Thermotogota bacterium]